MSLEKNMVTRDDLSILQLRAAVSGKVIAPEDLEYAVARTTFYGGIDRHPATIVCVANVTDVSRVVTFAYTGRSSG